MLWVQSAMLESTQPALVHEVYYCDALITDLHMWQHATGCFADAQVSIDLQKLPCKVV